jgi:hypothetical protein
VVYISYEKTQVVSPIVFDTGVDIHDVLDLSCTWAGIWKLRGMGLGNGRCLLCIGEEDTVHSILKCPRLEG